MPREPAEDFFWQMLAVIVNCGKGSRTVKIARQAGITGGTILLGRGTIGNRQSIWHDTLEIRKEIVLMVAAKENVKASVLALKKRLQLDKPHHGIAFVINLTDLMGSSLYDRKKDLIRKGCENQMYEAIFTIIDKGLAETVVEAAEAAGSRGATVINARGAGKHETSRLFQMDIEPEKEVVLIIVEKNASEPVKNAICQAVRLSDPGKGLLFAADVQSVCGLYGQ
jgi:nitrogen regulatory protein PII